MSGKKEYIRINPADSVAVALQPLAKGTDIILNDVRLTLLEDIPQGHKFALHTIWLTIAIDQKKRIFKKENRMNSWDFEGQTEV